LTADRATAFEADIAASPDALARLLDAWDAPIDPGDRRIALTGLGSSRFAAEIVAAALREAGRSAWATFPASGGGTAPSDDQALVAISASGRTPEVVEAAIRHRGRSLVVAVTNDPAGPLAGTADAVVPLLAGPETSGIACRTFRATIAALAMLTGLFTPAALRPIVAGIAERLAWLDATAAAFADALDGAPSIDVLAAAAEIGLAEQAALMLREAPRLPARAYETADWLHVGVYLALPGHRVVLFEGSPADEEVIRTIERRGGSVVRIAPPSLATTSIERALVDSVVGERVSAELWRRTSAIDKAT
jgi:glutamine---fructose-6-phosphate transaminase (isomerizing)